VQARIDAQLAILEAKEAAMQVVEVKGDRMPWFCSGCPHNTSTVGARRFARDGRHRLPFHGDWMDRSDHRLHADGRRGRAVGGASSPSPPTSTSSPTWATAPISTADLLAIRQSIAAGVNITYKVLYNDAVP
jgi:indolepyruvate ferredoxin oxidoreductase